MKKPVNIIVVGGINIDIIALGLHKLPSKGENIYGNQFKIGPGGKARNIANMIAVLTGKNKVAMLGKTSVDPYGLWKIPIDALNEAGINTNFIKILKSKKMPAVGMITVDNEGNNTIAVLPGVSDDFSPQDIESSKPLFKNAKYLTITLETPIKTTVKAIKMATIYNIKVLIDPGGFHERKMPDELFANKIFLLKPNEHEAKMLTGISVTNFETAKKSAKVLLGKNVENVLITAGKKGAYFFNKDTSIHIPSPKIQSKGPRDETGCGDQTIAALTAFLSEGKSLLESVKLSIIAGSLQFQEVGIQPINKRGILLTWSAEN